jgi:4-amino-4-deoxy-L-arabinose transferase-like glycosyltransferase
MILLVLFAIAFVARAAAGALFTEPAYPDSFYYVNVAHQLAAGHGFSIDSVWNFVDVGGRLPDQPMLPIPSNAHWMPLAAIVQVPFIWLIGATPLASALPFWLIGALAAPLTHLIAKHAGASRPIAFSAGLLAAVPAVLLPFTAQPDNFGLFMVLGALALLLAARAWTGDRRAMVAGGLVVGLATLSRTDGVLLGVPLAVAGLSHLWRSRAARPELTRWALGSAATMGLFLVVVGPWLVRQLEVFGSVTPSAASGRILWITDYRQLWSISDAPTLQTFLAQGLVALVTSRLAGFVAAIGIFVVWPLATVLAPFAIIGAWRRRRDRRFAPFFLYGALLFAASGLFFAVHVPYGTFIHSAVALVPHTFVLTMLGVEAVAVWLAERRAGWRPRRATLMFASVAVVVAVLAAALQTSTSARAWQQDRDAREALAPAFATAPVTDRVMSADAGAYEYLFDRAGVVTPDDPLPVIEQAAQAYGIRWLALEREHIVPALGPVLAGELHPAWLSAVPVVSQARVSDGALTAAVFAVCLSADDNRCAR